MQQTSPVVEVRANLHGCKNHTEGEASPYKTCASLDILGPNSMETKTHKPKKLNLY